MKKPCGFAASYPNAHSGLLAASIFRRLVFMSMYNLKRFHHFQTISKSLLVVQLFQTLWNEFSTIACYLLKLYRQKKCRIIRRAPKRPYEVESIFIKLRYRIIMVGKELYFQVCTTYAIINLSTN